ncbi:MAG: Gfo/Idh/MocA family oxidoreductase [Planctomycetaceae bacterium]|jgi:predicted dehydrogenase|nr:Gfo/Idh/MocA family oxidoreductase [Planctomycetaceae bacterium]
MKKNISVNTNIAMNTTRRTFLKTTALLAGTTVFPAPALLHAQNGNQKLNVACIGVSGMGSYSVGNVKGENVVALCDVEKKNLDKVGEQFPNAQRFSDFRKMFDQLDGKLDAVTVATPDHIHAAASVAAMNRGIHCYTEKPLAHDVAEVRKMIEVSKSQKLQTQMGTQIHAQPNYRRVVELIQAGAVGTIKEIHVWVNTAWGNRPIPPGSFDIPETLDWDLWLGPAAFRPYNPCYVPGNWRSYWAFGNGTLGDMACHYMDLPFWALGLRHPVTIETFGPPVDPECCSLGLTVKYEYPKTPNHEALTLTWYDHDLRPTLLKEHGMPDWGAGVIFVGSEGLLLSNYTEHHLYPEEKFKDYKRPEQTIPPSPGHHTEWLNAIKNGGTTSCNFDYSGTLTEAVLLGAVSYRVGKKIAWNPVTFKTDIAEADTLLSVPRREGWDFNL